MVRYLTLLMTFFIVDSAIAEPLSQAAWEKLDKIYAACVAKRELPPRMRPGQVKGTEPRLAFRPGFESCVKISEEWNRARIERLEATQGVRDATDKKVIDEFVKGLPK